VKTTIPTTTTTSDA